jgi:glycosyltransferase involved in cell wall biosynthesis
MKVLFAYPFCGLGGVETSILHKIEALRSIGVDASVLFSQRYLGGAQTIADRPNVFVGLGQAATVDLVRQFDTVCVVDHPGLIDTLTDAAICMPLLAETHVSLPSALHRLYRHLHHPFVRAVIVPSVFNRTLVSQTVGLPRRISVIPNAIDVSLFHPRNPAAASLMPPGDGPVVLWVGRLEDEKNPAGLLDVAGAVLRSRPDTRFLVVGDSEDYLARCADLKRRVGPDACSRLHFVQTVRHEDMPAVYALARETGGLLLSTSRFESVPMTFLEAMACECPVVSSRVGGTSELITEHVTGHLYDANDTASAAVLVLHLLNDRAHAQRLGTNGRRFVCARHALPQLARAYSAMLEDVAGPRPAPVRGGMLSRFEARLPKSLPALMQRSSRGMSVQQHKPLVSTIIPVFNRAPLLIEAIESVLSQTYRDVEVIVVDDGSTDETAAVCDRLAADNPQVRLVRQAHTGLAGLAREAGRRVAKGEFIQYLDSDDLLTPRKFEIMVEALTARSDCDVAYCSTRRYMRGQVPDDVPVQRTGHAFDHMFPEFLARRFWHTCSPLYRRRICDRVGPWSDLAFYEDIEYDMRVAALGTRIVHCPEFLADTRDHAFGRLSAPFWADAARLKEAVRAHSMVFSHAQRAGVPWSSDAARLFLDELRVLGWRCSVMGATGEANACAALIGAATGKPCALTFPRLNAVIQPLASRITAQAGATVITQVRVVNESEIAWRNGELSFGLSYHLLGPDGAMLTFDNARAYFDEPLACGSDRLVDLQITAPVQPGSYLVEIDIVCEHFSWFKQQGNATAAVPLRVS